MVESFRAQILFKPIAVSYRLRSELEASVRKKTVRSDLSPKNHTVMTMRIPVNLELRRSQDEKETVYGSADYWRDQVA